VEHTPIARLLAGAAEQKPPGEPEQCGPLDSDHTSGDQQGCGVVGQVACAAPHEVRTEYLNRQHAA
jgi:hypothetical protein